jgi:tRNA A-37 threonylcarbamoyl transferase component Bud32
LYSEKDAIRELAVSRKLEEISCDFPRVLYYRALRDYALPEEFSFLKNVAYSDKTPVDPCILYTSVKSPLRIADLQFFDHREKQEILDFYSTYFLVDISSYIRAFTEKLGERIGLMHANHFINDSLDYDNITLAAEITDYEWITAPGILLPDGSQGDVIQDERREKELIYALEAVLFLSAMLGSKHAFYELFEWLIGGYKKYNARFIENNQNINKILSRWKYII